MSPPRPNTQYAQELVVGRLAAPKPPLPGQEVEKWTREQCRAPKSGVRGARSVGGGLTGRERGDTLSVLVLGKVGGALGIRAERDRGETGSKDEAEHVEVEVGTAVQRKTVNPNYSRLSLMPVAPPARRVNGRAGANNPPR